MSYKNIAVYPLIEKRIEAYRKHFKDLSDLDFYEFVKEEVANTDITIIGLIKRPPKILQGKKIFAEYYLSASPDLQDFNTLAVRKDFTDIVENNQLKGLYIDYKFYDIEENIIKEKRVTLPFSTTVASKYEEERRVLSINDMVATSKDIDFVNEMEQIFIHYKTEIDNYLQFKDYDGFVNTLMNETDTTILGYLNTTKTIVDIEGNPLELPIKNLIIAGLYEGY